MEIAAPLRIGFVLIPDFTMLAFAAFIDTLRLAADKGDRSRPIACHWTVMGEKGDAVRASNGLMVQVDHKVQNPQYFDYIVVVGGTLHRGPEIGSATNAFLQAAATLHIPLVGICTGSFILARVGLMKGYRCCVSWFHKAEFEGEFPDIDVRGGELFVLDRDRITCAGGTSVIHLASMLIERHLGAGRSAKGLRIMIEERAREPSSPQPLPEIRGLPLPRDSRVRQAILLMESRLTESQPLTAVAAAIGTTSRHMRRLFMNDVGFAPREIQVRLRTAKAHLLLTKGDLPITTVAHRTGFSDASHLTRWCRREFGLTPMQLRNREE